MLRILRRPGRKGESLNMPIERIKAPKELTLVARRKKTSEIVAELARLRPGDALRLRASEYFPGCTRRAIYQAFWRMGRQNGLRIAYLYNSKKDSIVLTRADRLR